MLFLLTAALVWSEAIENLTEERFLRPIERLFRDTGEPDSGDAEEGDPSIASVSAASARDPGYSTANPRLNNGRNDEGGAGAPRIKTRARGVWLRPYVISYSTLLY